MDQESACLKPGGETALRSESISFSALPGQSALFLAYQADPLSLKSFYPSAVASHTELSACIPEVLANYSTDRAALCGALESYNRAIGSGERTFTNIARLAEPDAVAVVTGQQAGLFTGPLYTIYKALSAVKAAECLSSRGFKAVPVFWVATEDHDFHEVSSVHVPGRDASLAKVRVDPAGRVENVPVGTIELDGSIRDAVAELIEELRPSEFTPELRAMLDEAWAPGSNFGDAFARNLARILKDYGIVILDPNLRDLKGLVRDLYIQAIERSGDIVDALSARNTELRESGYEPQVLVEKGYFPLFWHADDGTRNALRTTDSGTVRAKAAGRDFTLDDLAVIARDEPAKFSPGVALRGVVQDFLLPTVAYFGGGAEVSYFAQTAEVYRVLGRPVTTVLHRQSFTVVEPKQAKLPKKFNLRFTDLFAGFDSLLPRIVDEHLDRDVKVLFSNVEERINTELNRLDQALSPIDPTLAKNLATRRRKILYHIGALRTKYHRARVRSDADLDRQLKELYSHTFPGSGLQERSLNIAYFLNRYGMNFTDWVYNSIDLDDRGHRLLYL